MSYIKKPKILRDNAKRNELGMTYNDYEAQCQPCARVVGMTQLQAQSLRPFLI